MPTSTIKKSATFFVGLSGAMKQRLCIVEKIMQTLSTCETNLI